MTIPLAAGIIAVPATPFTDDNRVDVASLRRYVRRALAAGVVGFLSPAEAGEVETLSAEERDLIVTTLLDELNGRVPLIGGATDRDPAAALDHARRYLALGCSGLLAYVRFENELAYAAQVEALDRLQPGFLMLQDLDRGDAPVPVPLLARLHQNCEHFTWLKVETADRCAKISALREATGGTLRLGTAGPEMIELMDRGVQAYLPTLYHEVYARIWSLYHTERRKEAIGLFYRLLPCLSFAASHKAIGHHIKKAVLQAEGVFATRHVRGSSRAPDAIEARLIDELCTYGLTLS